MFVFFILITVGLANHEQNLIAKLLKNYNKEIRPIRNVSEIIEVRFYMTLQQMISVVEKVFKMYSYRLVNGCIHTHKTLLLGKEP